MRLGFPVLIIFIVLLMNITSSKAQLYVRDTIDAFDGDTIALFSSNYEGNIQWQVSYMQPGFMNDAMFSDLKDAHHDTLQYIVTDSVIFFRAKVTLVNEGDSCLWYSDIYKIQTHEALPYLATISAVDSIEVLYNTPENSAMKALPKTTTIMDSDSSWYTVLLDWSIEGYSVNVPGEYDTKGAFDLPGGVVLDDSTDSLKQHVLTQVRVLEPQPPEVKTKHPRHILSNQAVVGGEIISNGGLEILEKGVLWDSAFVIDDNSPRLIIADTTSVFMDTLKNLQPDTRYYVQAYAINAVDTTYGLTNIFDTKPAQSNDSSFTVYYSNPYVWEEVYIHMMEELKKSAVDSTTWTRMNALNADSVWYYIEVPANNQQVIFSNGQEGTQTPVLEVETTSWYDGTQWHEEKPVDVGPFGPVTDIDGNQYETVVMGNQIWMAENLRTTHYQDGTPIENPQEQIAWANNTYGAYSWYNNDSVNYYQKGAIYNWYAIVNNSALCPDGWRMPNNADWNELFDYFERGDEVQLFQEYSNFYRTESGKFRTANGAAIYWSKNEYSSVYAYRAHLSSYFRSYMDDMSRANKQSGRIIRCLKDRSISGDNFIPKIKTLSADSTIMINSALLQGELQSTGGSEILEYGFYYDTIPDPQINGEKISFYDEIGLGNFIGEVSGLKPNRTYYYRAYAKNKRDEAIGYQHHFKTKWAAETIVNPDTLNYLYGMDASSVLEALSDSLPAICSDDDVFMIPVDWNIEAEDSLVVGIKEVAGTLFFPDSIDNPDYLFAQVVITMEEPTIINIDSIVVVPDTIYRQYNYSGKISELLPDTTQIIDTDDKVYDCYVDWAVQDSLTNEYVDTLEAVGTIHLPLGYKQAEPGTDLFVNNTLVVEKYIRDFDENKYHVVKIGNQVWMAENLKSTHYANGNPIPESYYYQNNSTYLNAYGRLYTWDAVMNGASSNNDNPGTIQGVCPDGWHVPGKAEWEELIDTLGGTTIAGAAMKSTLTETETHPYWNSPNSGATNDSGFSAMPGGKGSSSWFSISYAELGYSGYWWSATQSSYSAPWYMKTVFSSESATMYYEEKTSGMSIRCVKD